MTIFLSFFLSFVRFTDPPHEPQLLRGGCDCLVSNPADDGRAQGDRIGQLRILLEPPTHCSGSDCTGDRPGWYLLVLCTKKKSNPLTMLSTTLEARHEN